ncbi:hypothetical protein LUZ60_006120 [Juncus effusus]|nr:hypothetical protein LUZ60_006120 [Juncus effusus]
MAYRKLHTLLRRLRIPPPLTTSRLTPTFSGSQNSVSGFSFNERLNFGSRQNHWGLIVALLFSGQAVIVSDEGKFVFAQDDSNSNGESITENNIKNENQANITSLQKIEDGSVISNEHTIKWRLLTDSARELFQNGKINEAEKAFKLALEEAKEGFGQRDPHVASSCNNLAEFYRVKKEFDKAEPLYLEAVNILEDSLGTDDVRVGAALHNLGQFYLAQHKFDQAQTCYEVNNYIKGRVLGYNNPDYASTMHHLGRVFYLQGKEKDAEALISESIKILEENGLGESPTCIRRMRSLSQILIKSNKPAEAEIIQRKILHALEISQGWKSLETVNGAETLALTLQSLGILKESRELLERCLEVRKKLLSEDHVQVASNMVHLARLALYDSKFIPQNKISAAQNDLNESKKLLETSIRIIKAKLKKEQRNNRELQSALLIFLQALDAIGHLEIKKHEIISPQGSSEYPYEAELALKECISIYKEPYMRRVLDNVREVKSQYITCLNRLSNIIQENGNNLQRTEAKDLIEETKLILDELSSKKKTA